MWLNPQVSAKYPKLAVTDILTRKRGASKFVSVAIFEQN